MTIELKPLNGKSVDFYIEIKSSNGKSNQRENGRSKEIIPISTRIEGEFIAEAGVLSEKLVLQQEISNRIKTLEEELNCIKKEELNNLSQSKSVTARDILDNDIIYDESE